MRVAALIVAFAVACGPSPAPVKDQGARLELPEAGPTAAPAAKTARLGLPRDPALEISADVASLLTLSPLLRAEIENALGLAPGSFDLSAFGVDARRPIVLAIAALDEAQRKLVASLRRVAATNAPTPATEAAIRDVLALGVESPVRVLFPITNLDKALATLDVWLRREGWRPRGADAYARGHAVVVLSHDEATLALDFAAARTDGVAAAIARSAFASAAEPASGLDGDAARLVWRPDELALFGFIKGVIATCSAVSGGSVDPSQRDRIAAQGFWEAGKLFALAGAEKGAYFDRVEVSARLAPFEVSMRARPGPGLALPADAFKPSVSVAIDGAWAEVEAGQSVASAWGVVDGSKLLESVRDGGLASWLVALPQLLASAPAVALAASLPEALPDPAFLARFERTTVAWTAQDAVFAGVLPASASRASAECALARSSLCDAKSRLKSGVIIAREGRAAELLEIDHRRVVLVARDQAALANIKTLSRAGGAVHVEVELAQIASAFHLVNLPARVTGELASASDGALVFRLAP